MGRPSITLDPEANTEYLARKIIVNINAGNDVSSLIDTLLALQNSDGGFGDRPAYASSVLDTAMAMEALAAANVIDSEATGSAVNFLLHRQQANGGWLEGANESSVYLTALATRALWFYRAAFQGVSVAANDAQNFLLSQRGSGGLWDEQFESALAMLAIVPNLTDLSLVDHSAGALRSAQWTNGSWNDDVFTTALVLRAQEVYDNRKGSASPAPNGSISGVVIREGSAQPVDGATVSIREIPGITVSSNGDGYFLIPGLPAGTYTITADKAGFSSASVVAAAEGGTVTSAGTLVLTMAKETGLVIGKIYDAQGLAVLPGASVTLAGSTIHSTLTGAAGQFDLGALLPGAYNVTIAQSGYESFSGTVHVTAGQTLFLNQGLIKAGGFQDDSPGEIRGIAVDAKTGSPVAGAIFDLGNGQTAGSDANGQFVIASAARGSYYATLSADGYVTRNYFFGFPPGHPGDLGVLALHEASALTAPTSLTLQVLVTDGVTGAPVPGANISLIESGAAAATDVTGRAVMDGIVLQSFSLAVSAFGYQSNIVTLQSLSFGAASISIALSPLGDGSAVTTLRGSVTDSETGAAVSAAQLRVDNGSAASASDANGQYTLIGIERLSFTLTVTAPGYRDLIHPIQLAEHGTFNLDLALTPQPILTEQFRIGSITPDQSVWEANTQASFSAEISNLQTVDASALITGEIVDAAGTHVASVSPYAPGTQLPQAGFDFTAGETKTLTFPWLTAQHMPGTYRLIVRVSQPGSVTREIPWGVVVTEGSGYGYIQETAAIAGALSINPPVAQAGATVPVQLSALLRNAGNVPLAAGGYTLTITDPGSGTPLHFAQVEAGPLAPVQFTPLDFGQWLPSAAGDLEVRVSAQSAGIAGAIVDRLYVGQVAKGTFTVDRNIVPEGTQTVQGSIRLEGVDVSQGGVSDPLFALVKEAVERGGAFVGPEAVAWDQRNRCFGCHIQTQSLTGLASSLDKADIDPEATEFLYNRIITGQRSQGELEVRSLDAFAVAKISTTLSLWSLTSWPDKLANFMSKFKAARYLFRWKLQDDDQTLTYWDTERHEGWWRTPETETALTAMAIADLLRTVDDPSGPPVNEYKLRTSVRFNQTGSERYFKFVGSNQVYLLVGLGLTTEVRRFDLSTREATTIGTGLSGYYRSLAVDTDGTVYVAGPTLVKINPNGSRQTLFQPERDLHDVEIGPDGWLYASEFTFGRIWRVSKTGEVELFASGPLVSGPLGLSFDLNGDLFVANYYRLGITKIYPDGRMEDGIKSMMATAQDVAHDSEGNLYYYTRGTVLRDGSNPIPVSLYRVTPDGVVERMLEDNYYLGQMEVKNDQVFVLSSGSLHRVATETFDPALLDGFRNELPLIARYFLNNYQDGNPNLIVNAMRLTGLGELRTVVTDPDLLAELDTAIAFIADQLRSRQHADGGWGTLTSDALKTALVGLALEYTDPSPNDPMVRNAIEFLLKQQLPDGSWESVERVFGTKLGSTSLVMAYMPKALARLGGIDVGLHLTIPESVQLQAPFPVPTSVAPNFDNSTAYFWDLKGISAEGLDIAFGLDVLDLQLNEVRPVASEAYLEFENSFTGEQLRVDLDIPTLEARSELSLAVSVDQSAYQANEDVLVTPVVSNGGPLPASADVYLGIRPAGGGVPLAELPPIPVTDLAAGEQLTLSALWNTGSVLIGDFEVYGRLLDTQGRLLAKTVTPFGIGSPAVLASTSVVTDKPVYDAWDTVAVTARVRNTAVNAFLPATRLELTVRTPGGAVLFFDTHTLRELTPGAQADVPFSLPLVDARSGDYAIELVLKDDFTRAVLSASANSFQVERRALQGLTGSASVAAVQVFVGDPNACTVTVKNISTTAVTGVTLTHQIIAAEQGVVLAEVAETVDLAGNGTHGFTRQIDTSGFDIGGYTCVTQAELNGDTKTLAFVGFQVLERPIRLEGELNPGSRGRLLVLLDGTKDHGAGDKCRGVTQLDLIAPITPPLSPQATVEVIAYHKGSELDREVVALANATIPVDANTGTGADLSVVGFAGNALTVQLAATAEKLGTELGVMATLYDGGMATTLSSGSIHTSCSRPIAVGNVHGAFTITGLTTREAANDDEDDDSEGDGDHDDGDKHGRDPHGPKQAPGLDEQREFIETLLTDAGWSYTLTETAEAFTRELNSGGYELYALFNEHEKLSKQLQKELREAVYRGEGLLVAGPHDKRNTHKHRLGGALGVKVHGHHRKATAVALPEGVLSDAAGTIELIPKDKALKLELLTAESLAAYVLAPGRAGKDDEDCTDEDEDDRKSELQARHNVTPYRHDDHDDEDEEHDEDDDEACHVQPDAITVNAYGEGKGLFAGFDWLATATGEGLDSLAAQALLKALAQVSPAGPSTLAGAVLPLELTLTNQGIATTARVTLNLPAGTSVIDAPGTGYDDTQVQWTVSLIEEQVLTLPLYLRLPDTDGSITLTGTVTAPVIDDDPGALQAELSLTVEVQPVPDAADLTAALDGLPDKLKKKVAKHIDHANKALPDDPDKALKEALKAADELVKADPTPESHAVRLMLARWVRWIAMQL